MSWPAPPLEWIGHTSTITCTSYPPNGCYIASGSMDCTIRFWGAETGSAVSNPLEGHTGYAWFVSNSPALQLLISGSIDRTVALGGPIPPVSRNVSSPGHHISADFGAQQPDSEGWLKDSEGRLLYWVPKDCHTGLHSLALMTIPWTSDIWSVSLDFEEFVFGTSWTQIFNITHP